MERVTKKVQVPRWKKLEKRRMKKVLEKVDPDLVRSYYEEAGSVYQEEGEPLLYVRKMRRVNSEERLNETKSHQGDQEVIGSFIEEGEPFDTKLSISPHKNLNRVYRRRNQYGNRQSQKASQKVLPTASQAHPSEVQAKERTDKGFEPYYCMVGVNQRGEPLFTKMEGYKVIVNP